MFSFFLRAETIISECHNNLYQVIILFLSSNFYIVVVFYLKFFVSFHPLIGGDVQCLLDDEEVANGHGLSLMFLLTFIVWMAT